MKGRRTVNSTTVFTLKGGTEDNDLWGYYVEDDRNNSVVATVWVPTDKERERIANGENIRLLIWGVTVPPIAMDITDEQIGKAPNEGTVP